MDRILSTPPRTLPSLRLLCAGPEIVDFAQDVQPIFRSRCYTCHGPSKQTNGLRLDRKEAALQGGTSGRVIVPGSSAQSKLVQRVASTNDAFRMPPVGPRLTAAEIATLTSWIDQGAKWPLSPPAVTRQVAPSQQKQHWSFQPVRRPTAPRVRRQAWVRNPIDAFVLAKLESKDISPAPEADRATLIRRLNLDLLGLPPTPTEVDAFVSDTRPDAYERLVDRLLASPHYGERWGRHWLDLARYADSNGYNTDTPREIWMYRDWVIGALNRDLPFDQFVIEQIAGDLLPSATKQQIVATGFHRNTLINLEGGIDFDQYRVEAVVDRVETTGAVFLGLTLGCARCHDHKYDPVSQREFYQFYAFFNNIDELGAEYQLGVGGKVGRARAQEPILEFGTAEQLVRREASRTQIAVLEKELEEYEKPLRARLAACCETLTDEERSKLKPEILEILKIPPEKRSHFQNVAAEKAFRKMDLGYTERQAGIKALRDIEPKVPSTLVMRELPEPRQAYVHLGGDFLRKGIDVEPGVPAMLPPLPESENANRLDLARWLVDAKNPLTPRVTVNRIWQRYFGRGLVETRERLRHAGIASLSSGFVGLAGCGVYRSGVEPEGDAQSDRELGDLSTIVGVSARACRDGPDQPASRTARAASPGGGNCSRHGHGRQRAVHREDRGAECFPAAAGRRRPVDAGRSPLGCREGRRSLSPRDVYLFLASQPPSRADDF